MLPIACHLWCYRQVLGKDGLIEKLDAALAQVSAAGYVGVQHFLDSVTSPSEAARFAKLLDQHGVRAAGIYAGGPLHEAKTARAFEKTLVAAARVARDHFDIKSITFNPEPRQDQKPKTDAQLERQAESLRRLSDDLVPLGLRLIYHFHLPEMADDAREFKQMMRLVPHRYMGVCFEPDWVHRAGIPPGDLLDMFAPRMQEIHLRSTRDGVWDEALREGEVRLQDLLELLEDYDFKGWHVVELSREAQTPKTLSLPESLRRSYHYASQLLMGSRSVARMHFRDF